MNYWNFECFRGSFFLLIVFMCLTIPSVEATATAKPKQAVHWDVPGVDEFLSRGETRSTTLTFTSRSNLNGIWLNVSPDLLDIVTVSPQRIDRLRKGKTYTIEVTYVAALEASFETISGTISLSMKRPKESGKDSKKHKHNKRKSKNSKIYFSELPLALTITAEPIPPDPGEAGKTSLVGIDSDEDGLRDDIQRYIVLTYPDSQRTRLGATQYAKDLQEAILASNSQSRSKDAFRATIRSSACLAYVRDDDARLKRQLEAIAFNTEDRLNSYLLYRRLLEGDVYSFPSPGEWKATCQFDVDAMES